MPGTKGRVFDLPSSNKFAFVSVYFIAALILLISVFLFTSPASAQEEAPSLEISAEVAPPDNGTDAAVIAEEPALEEKAPEASSEAVMQDEVTHEDFGVSEARVLPDSRLYGFKRFGRRLREAVTFNPVKKTELTLRHANQELSDAKTLVDERGDDPKAVEAATDAIVRFERKIETIRGNVSDLESRRASGDASINDAVNNMIDKQIKQQKILDSLEQGLLRGDSSSSNDALISRVVEARDHAAEATGEVVFFLEKDKARLAERFSTALEHQRGSEFKELRNVEVLKQLEGRLPENARQAIRQAQENTLRRFAGELSNPSDKGRDERFEQYVRHVGGDETRHFEIMDELKSRAGEQGIDFPPELIKKMEEAKDILAQRFQEKVEGIDSQFTGEEFRTRARERAFARFKDGGADVNRLRAIEGIGKRVQFDDKKLQEEVKKHEEEAVNSFITAFPDAQADAEQFKALSQKMAENPDPTTFRLLQELEAKVKADPKKREFIEQMERGAKAQFAKRAQEEQGKFLERIASTNPDDIAVFQQLQKDFAERPEDFVGGPPFRGAFPEGVDSQFPSRPQFFPPAEFQQFFDQAVSEQAGRVSDHLNAINDPSAFSQFEKKFQNVPPEVLEEMKHRQGDFEQRFKEKQQFIGVEKQEFELRRELDTERARFEQALRVRSEQAQTDEDRRAIEEERSKNEQSLQEREMQKRKEVFEQRLQFDPFCDDACKQEEKKRFDTLINREQGRFQDMQKLEGARREVEQFIREKQGTMPGQPFDREFTPREGQPKPSFNAENPSQFKRDVRPLPPEAKRMPQGKQEFNPEQFRNERGEQLRFDESDRFNNQPQFERRPDGQQGSFQGQPQFDRPVGPPPVSGDFRRDVPPSFTPPQGQPNFAPPPQGFSGEGSGNFSAPAPQPTFSQPPVGIPQ